MLRKLQMFPPLHHQQSNRLILPNSEESFLKHVWPPQKLGCSPKLSIAPRPRPADRGELRPEV
jgi:hypothetical protein